MNASKTWPEAGWEEGNNGETKQLGYINIQQVDQFVLLHIIYHNLIALKNI